MGPSREFRHCRRNQEPTISELEVSLLEQVVPAPKSVAKRPRALGRRRQCAVEPLWGAPAASSDTRLVRKLDHRGECRFVLLAAPYCGHEPQHESTSQPSPLEEAQQKKTPRTIASFTCRLKTWLSNQQVGCPSLKVRPPAAVNTRAGRSQGQINLGILPTPAAHGSGHAGEIQVPVRLIKQNTAPEPPTKSELGETQLGQTWLGVLVEEQQRDRVLGEPCRHRWQWLPGEPCRHGRKCEQPI